MRKRLGSLVDRDLFNPVLSGVSVITFYLFTQHKADTMLAAAGAAWKQKIGKEGYVLILNKEKRIVAANTETGLFYGLQTVQQLWRANWHKDIFIADWPSYDYRVVYDDISRGPISTVGYIKKQIERLAEIKINYLSFYIEHIVQPLSHPDFAPANGKLTIAQIKELSAYAARFHMQLIGSFQSFGHFEKILSLPQYQSMGETSTLISPLDPKARRFLKDVIGELCNAFNAPFFNVNCDETFDLGKGKSKKYTDSIGVARFYADHIKFLYDIVQQHHKKLMMWGDVALQHEEILDMLPKDIIYLTWEYGDQPSFDTWITPFAKRKLDFIVCPGILNSNRMFPDMVMAKANIRSFLPAGKLKGASGAVTTVWDDGGTYLFSNDWYGVYMAAEKSWNTDSTINASFDHRYECTAYGLSDGYYALSLQALMELRNIPLTYNLTDQLWNQKILPAAGKTLIVNNSTASSAMQFLHTADKLISLVKPERNEDDIQSLRYSIHQYMLMIETRIQLASIADIYAQIIHEGENRNADKIIRLQQAIGTVEALKDRYTKLQNTFTTAWLHENQRYWLDIASRPYVDKIHDLQQLVTHLHQAIAAIQKSMVIPAAKDARLNLIVNNYTYFQNWMLGGPFPLENTDQTPAFLYAENAAYNKPPSPGDFTQYKNKVYRWQKFASPDGGIIDLSEHYQHAGKAAAYAYCAVTSDKATTVRAFIKSVNEKIFCNGNEIQTEQNSQEEKEVSLPLVAGVNHILLKIPSDNNWMFTFRLDPAIRVINRKHKYTINPQTKLYEAE